MRGKLKILYHKNEIYNKGKRESFEFRNLNDNLRTYGEKSTLHMGMDHDSVQSKSKEKLRERTEGRILKSTDEVTHKNFLKRENR